MGCPIQLSHKEYIPITFHNISIQENDIYRRDSIAKIPRYNWHVFIAWCICLFPIFQPHLLELWQIVHCDWLIFILEEMVMLFFQRYSLAHLYIVHPILIIRITFMETTFPRITFQGINSRFWFEIRSEGSNCDSRSGFAKESDLANVH